MELNTLRAHVTGSQYLVSYRNGMELNELDGPGLSLRYSSKLGR